MFNWIIEQREGQWCVVQTYYSREEDESYEKVFFESSSQSDAIQFRADYISRLNIKPTYHF